jgi:P-type conjugative transfer protein TrbL
MPINLPDASVLAHLLQQVSGQFDGQGQTFIQDAQRMMNWLTAIEIVFLGLWASLDGSSAVRRALHAVVRFGLFVWLVAGWPKLMATVLDGFQQTGSRLSHQTVSTTSLSNLMGDILTKGAADCNGLLTLINQLSLDGAHTSGELNLLVICYTLAMAGFFLAAAQILLVSVEFLVVAVLGIVLLPFGVFARTAFLAENILRTVVVLGVRKMIMVLMALALTREYDYYTFPTLQDTQTPGAVPMAFDLMFWGLAIGLLVWRVPLHISALASKAPSLFPALIDGHIATSMNAQQATATAQASTLPHYTEQNVEAVRSAAALPVEQNPVPSIDKSTALDERIRQRMAPDAPQDKGENA